MNIGLMLKKSREQAKITQTVLSSKMGVSLRTIQLWEAESVDIPLKKLKKIIEILNIDKEKLMSALFPTQIHELDRLKAMLNCKTNKELASSLGEPERFVEEWDTNKTLPQKYKTLLIKYEDGGKKISASKIIEQQAQTIKKQEKIIEHLKQVISNNK